MTALKLLALLVLWALIFGLLAWLFIVTFTKPKD